jgi:acetyltransferase-like isoleucine patch superfamily enzyme
MGLGLLTRYYNWIGRSYYKGFGIGLLLLNFIVQRIFRVNAEVPYSVHYSNKITGWKNCFFEDEKVLANLCASGGAYIAVFDETTLHIGSGTIWAYNVCIQTADHVPGRLSNYKKASVKIGRNCWLGNGVVITAGVELGDHVVVGANSVVTKSFPSNVVIAGVPAKVIRQIEV